DLFDRGIPGAVGRTQLSGRALRQRAARPQPERVTSGCLDSGYEVSVLEIVRVIGRHRIGMQGPARVRDERTHDAARTVAAPLRRIEARRGRIEGDHEEGTE